MSDQAKQIRDALTADQRAEARRWDDLGVENLAIGASRRVSRALEALRETRSDLLVQASDADRWDWAREVEPMIHGLMGGLAVVAALLAEVVADTALEDPLVAALVDPEATS